MTQHKGSPPRIHDLTHVSARIAKAGNTKITGYRLCQRIHILIEESKREERPAVGRPGEFKE